MDNFYEYLRNKYFVNYENNEIKDISKAMDVFLGQLRDTFNESSEVLQIETLIPCGSMEEKTTVWGEEITAVEYDPHSVIKTIEFDCVAVLKPLVPDMKMEDSCPGYKKIKSQTLSQVLEEKKQIEESDAYKKALSEHDLNVMKSLRFLLTCEPEDVSAHVKDNSDNKPPSLDTFIKQQMEIRRESNEDISLLQNVLQLHKFANGKSKTIATEFMVIVDDAAEELCKTNEAQAVNDDDDDDDRISTFQMDTSSGTLKYGRCLHGCQLALNWESKTNPSHNKIVYADFVPAFQVPPAQSSHTADDLPNYLVAKGCRNSECTSGCWRLSHCLAEMKDIKSTSQSHRDVYKIFKIFNHNILSRRLDNALKSYHIKTALLRHISQCKNSNNDITECICQVLAILNTYVKDGKVPHWKDPNYYLILIYDTCHSFVPTMLQFVFDKAVKHSPLRLYLTICCETKGDNEMHYYKSGCKISDLVCRIMHGDKCFEQLEAEIENTISEAADLAPYYHQHRLRYSMFIDTTDSPPDTVTIYQRCGRF